MQLRHEILQKFKLVRDAIRVLVDEHNRMLARERRDVLSQCTNSMCIYDKRQGNASDPFPPRRGNRLGIRPVREEGSNDGLLN